MIASIISGSRIAYSQLIEKYSAHSKLLANAILKTQPLKNNGYAFDDLVSIALYSVVIALKYYDIETGNQFYPYWKEIAKKEIYDFINKNSYSGEARIFSNYLPLSDACAPEGHISFEELVPSNDGYTLSEFISYDETSNRISEIAKTFSETDRKILYMLIIGCEIKDIKDRLNISASKIYQSLRRIKRKIKLNIDK